MVMQARLCALVFTGQHLLPNISEMKQAINDDETANIEQFEGNAIRIRSLVDYHRYINDLSKVIGCFPPLKKYFFLNPKIWFHMMYGPTQATQFRLRGPANPGRTIAVGRQVRSFPCAPAVGHRRDDRRRGRHSSCRGGQVLRRGSWL